MLTLYQWARQQNGRTEGREWGRGGEQIQRGMLQSCPQPHKKHCQLLSYAWCLGKAESSGQSVWDRKDKDFICQLLPISCLSLVFLHPIGCEFSYIFWFINSGWGSQSLYRSNEVRSFSRILWSYNTEERALYFTSFCPHHIFLKWGWSRGDSLSSFGGCSCDEEASLPVAPMSKVSRLFLKYLKPVLRNRYLVLFNTFRYFQIIGVWFFYLNKIERR